MIKFKICIRIAIITPQKLWGWKLLALTSFGHLRIFFLLLSQYIEKILFPVKHHDIGLTGQSWYLGILVWRFSEDVFFKVSLKNLICHVWYSQMQGLGTVRCKFWLTNLLQLMKEISIFLHDSFYRQVFDKKPENYCLGTI